MPKQVDVLVKDISKDENGRPSSSFGSTQTLSYKTFLILTENPEDTRFELVGEIESVDKDGNIKLREGSPNLQAQHRTAPPKRSVEPVVNSGPTQKELEQQAEIEALKAQLTAGQAPAAATPERKKPGPKPKATATPVEA